MTYTIYVYQSTKYEPEISITVHGLNDITAVLSSYVSARVKPDIFDHENCKQTKLDSKFILTGIQLS